MNELTQIKYNNEIVITTKTLAEVYGCEVNNIKKNFNLNKDKFKEGMHYFKLEGEELKEFKEYNKVTNSNLVEKRAKCLFLWTKRGASRHCKMLGTDKAWQMFDSLEENYFNPKPQLQLSKKEALQLSILNGDNMNKIVALKEYEKLITEEVTKPLIKNTTSLLEEIKKLKKDVKTLNDKLDFQNKNLNNENKIINPKEENKNIINDFNYSRFLNHINELSADAKLTKKEFINLFNSYNFYHKNLGIMELNRLLRTDNLIFGNDRLTKYAKDSKILTRDNYKKHAKVFITKKGMLYLINLLK